MLPNNIEATVRLALAEDVGSGDLSAALIPGQARARARVIAREAAVLCGTAWFNEVFWQLDDSITTAWKLADGNRVQPGETLCELQGAARAILTGERTALNFLQTLSGTATRAGQFADAVAGTQARILDTRKTLPCLRQAQKYAVRCGGCANHRMGLYDGILIKENHLRAIGSIRHAIRQAQRSAPTGVMIEVEVTNLDEMKEALSAGAERLLLDNFPLEQLKAAVSLANRQTILEASGGVTLDNIRVIAETGVDYISVGDLTKSVAAIDLSMQFDLPPRT